MLALKPEVSTASEEPAQPANGSAHDEAEPQGAVVPILPALIAGTKACLLRPLVFFPSWSGVLTLAWAGWPEVLRTLKQDINANLPALPKENPGENAASVPEWQCAHH